MAAAGPPGEDPYNGRGPPKKFSKSSMRGYVVIDTEDGDADVTDIYTKEDDGRRDKGKGREREDEGDERPRGDERQRGQRRNRMKGWAYVDDEDGGRDVTHLYSGEPVARRREEERESEERMSSEGVRRSGRSRRARREDEDEDMEVDENEDTEMGGMDDSSVTYPSGSMNNTPAGSRAPLAPPFSLPGLPAPNQPNRLIPIPRNAAGRGERRLLNAGQSRGSASASGAGGRSRRDVDPSSTKSNKSDDSTLSTIVVDTGDGTWNPRPIASSSRPVRREKPKRRRSASPERVDDEIEEYEDGNDYEDDDDDDGDGFVHSSKPSGGRAQRSNKRRKPTPLTDEQYEQKYGKKRKCKECTRMRVTCSDYRPCAKCVNTGKVCEPVHGDGIPYSASGPPRNDFEDEDDDGVPVASSSSRRGPGRPRGRPRRNVAPPPDALERTWAEFNGLFNPFNYRIPEVEGVPTAEVPTADRLGAQLSIPAPPFWHAIRSERVTYEQRHAQGYINQENHRRAQDAQRMEAAALADLGPGMGFGGTAELAYRPRWDRQTAGETWYTNASDTAVPIVVHPEPERYDVNRPSDPMPDFGRNMENIGLSINTQVPAPPHGEQIPWIATWNFEGQRNTETRGPLGWPYPTIGALDHGHKHNTPGIFDPVTCCENANQFVHRFVPSSRTSKERWLTIESVNVTRGTHATSAATNNGIITPRNNKQPSSDRNSTPARTARIKSEKKVEAGPKSVSATPRRRVEIYVICIENGLRGRRMDRSSLRRII
ncbi:hypothetical protein IFR04_006737 [Cadophora malorum]|uniref:Zn(2)-C6 fungal-type domain-containing protein n=1 Tax=Cadophora malorum TaxID=108018 RepID=A0A8H7TJJ6_9HELO|nr:hypothetical protein IFR04_006737 [Cadophora malorum]